MYGYVCGNACRYAFVTLSYDNALHYGLSKFEEFEKFPYPSVIPISVRFQKSSDLLLSHFWSGFLSSDHEFILSKQFIAEL